MGKDGLRVAGETQPWFWEETQELPSTPLSGGGPCHGAAGILMPVGTSRTYLVSCSESGAEKDPQHPFNKQFYFEILFAIGPFCQPWKSQESLHFLLVFAFRTRQNSAIVGNSATTLPPQLWFRELQ